MKRTFFARPKQFLPAALAVSLAFAAAGATPSQAAEIKLSAHSLAVLPFANVGEAAQEAFVDGMTEEIVSALARAPGLQVAARSSSFKYKGQTADAKAIGRTLGVSYLVEGSIRKFDDRIRLSAKLVRANDGKEMWSQDYYSQFSDVFDIEDDIAKSVAAALGTPAPGASPSSARTADMDAYEQYVRARPLIRARGREPFAQAAVQLEQVVAKQPDFAPAVAMLAFDYDLAPLYQQSLRSGDTAAARRFVDSVVPKAETLARRAIQLDSKNADAYLALAYADMVQGKLLQSLDQFQLGLKLDPDNPNILHGYSQLLAATGRVKDSIDMRWKLQALEPFFVNYVADTAEIIWLDGENDKAIEMLNAFRPNRTLELAQTLASMGRYHDAANALREMGTGNYLPGVLDSAASLLDSAPAKTESPQSLPRLGNLGFIYIYVGAPERDLEYYESNLAAGYFQPISSTWFWHKSYAPVRKLERFKTFARNIGLVEVWRARGWPAQCHAAGADDFACE